MRAQDPGKATDAAKPRRSASRTASTVASTPGTTAAAMHELQRTVGNAAVARVLQREAHQHTADCGHGQSASSASSVAQIQRDAVRDVLGSRGRTLPEPVQREAEGRLGVPQGSFRSVEIHDSSRDKEVARTLGAVAFTSRRKIVGDVSRKKTLLHELIHVGQQARGPVPGTDTGNGLKVSDENDPKEKEAVAGSTRALAAPFPARPAPGGGSGSVRQ